MAFISKSHLHLLQSKKKKEFSTNIRLISEKNINKNNFSKFLFRFTNPKLDFQVNYFDHPHVVNKVLHLLHKAGEHSKPQKQSKAKQSKGRPKIIYKKKNKNSLKTENASKDFIYPGNPNVNPE